jgi:ATPase subunit of ABC transporter with duplicated ATPase domains
MTIININALGMTLGKPLFSDLNLTMSKIDRIGLVAQNGRGKSTLLAVLAGLIAPTIGEVTRARGTCIGYVKPIVPDEALQLTLQDWLAALPRDVPVVIIPHDRALLDATTNRTLFFRTESSRVFQLPLTAARDALNDADEIDFWWIYNDLNKIQTLRKQAAKPKNMGHNSGSDLLLKKTR